MTAGIPSGPAAGTMTPAEREAHWRLYARFAIEAASEDEARAVLGQAPGNVAWQLPQNGEREAKAEWPPDIWVRRPGPDDLLLHPKVQAVTIFCVAQ
jgi:hypothetical protein